MKHIELYRKIAILLYETNYEVCLRDVCAYLNAEAGFFEQTKIRELSKYIKHASGLSKKVLHKLHDAEEAALDLYFENREEYSPAQEYSMLSGAVYLMSGWEGFAEANAELFRETAAHMKETEDQILRECETSMAEECQDLMTEGRIPEEHRQAAILRYMAENGFVPDEEA